MTLKTQKLSGLEQVRSFLAGTAAIVFAIPTGQDRYGWVAQSLKQFHYQQLRRPERGLIVRFLCKVTGYSRAQITRLIAQWCVRGTLTDRRAAPAVPFARRYGAIELGLLAELDRLHGTLSGPATKKLAERAFTIFHQPQYERLAAISVSHLYNLRRSTGYRRVRGAFVQHTRATSIPIGERRKPNPQGQPGYLRVDSVHQGDFEGVKGLYLINAVDEITQFQLVAAVERISELFLLPALESMIASFPFVIRGFHADNGSEYINHQVAAMLDKLRIEFTKSRSRHSNDNALAESKNASVVRKHLGYAHIPAYHAQMVNTFTIEHLSPYLNFHRPCFFARTRTNDKGKIEKFYLYRDMMTPYDKLKSLLNAARFLKPDLSFKELDALALRVTDNEAAAQLNRARTKLFELIRLGRKRA